MRTKPASNAAVRVRTCGEPVTPITLTSPSAQGRPVSPRLGGSPRPSTASGLRSSASGLESRIPHLESTALPSSLFSLQTPRPAPCGRNEYQRVFSEGPRPNGRGSARSDQLCLGSSILQPTVYRLQTTAYSSQLTAYNKGVALEGDECHALSGTTVVSRAIAGGSGFLLTPPAFAHVTFA